MTPEGSVVGMSIQAPAMSLDRLPPELISMTLSFLDNSTLCDMRLVSRAYNPIATKHLFHHVEFLPTEVGLQKWHALTSDPSLSALPRHATIYTSPFPHFTHWNSGSDLVGDDLISTWDPDPEDEDYASFYSGIDALSKLPSLEKVTLHFMYSCLGEESPEYLAEFDGYELIEYRLDMLTRVFKAIEQRHKVKPEASRITSLKLQNLQNVPLPEFTGSKVFHSVMNDVEHLHLVITEEFNEPGPDNDLDCIERRTFMPYLVEHWLAPFAPQLKSLCLKFPECWGAIPGRFDASCLDFPNLEKLTLKVYCFAHDEDIDWIVRPKNLKWLYLKKCQMLTYARLDPDRTAEWSVSTDDWERKSELDPGWGDNLYLYPGAWATIFDKIRTEARNLTRFTLRWKDREQQCYNASSAALHNWDSDHVWGVPPEREQWLAEQGPPPAEEALRARYVAFDHGILPSAWLALSKILEIWYRPQSADGEKAVIPDRDAETYEEDGQALRRLLCVVADRQRSGG